MMVNGKMTNLTEEAQQKFRYLLVTMMVRELMRDNLEMVNFMVREFLIRLLRVEILFSLRVTLRMDSDMEKEQPYKPIVLAK